MLNKKKFIFAHQAMDKQFYSTYKNLKKNEWKPYDDLKYDQEKQLKLMVNFAYNNVPYYHNLFRKLRLRPENIKKTEDLEKIPILTKELVIKNWEEFKPINLNKINYYNGSTGGSTGSPLKYRYPKYDRLLSGVLLYRGWGYGGYELGDKMIFLAGSSLDIGTKSKIVTKTHEFVRNIRKLSSFNMDYQEMLQYTNIFNSFKPKFLRGYPSSINFFAKYLEEANIEMHTPSAVFTTSEKLLPEMRTRISDVFDCDVYDNYGLGDGGVSAYECDEHNGLHVATEKSIMEIVDRNGKQIESGTGRIIATSLYNYSMPFLRYQTGDLGNLVADVCGCGRGSKLLKEVIGRQHEMLQTPEGKFVHGAFFNSYMFGKISGIVEFQVIQKSLENIVVKIVADENFDEKQLDNIRTIIKSKSERWNIEFKFVDQIERTKAGKYKFIVNEVGK